MAQTLPGPADAGRIEQRVPDLPTQLLKSKITPPQLVKPVEAPKGSEKIPFTLRRVDIKNMQAFTDDQMRDVYAEYLDQKVTLDIMWLIAGKITERYQQAGYFLSRAYVPAQEIGTGGVVTIQVVEGYIDEVNFDEKVSDNAMAVEWANRLKGVKPLRVDQLESTLLRLNDLPGQDFRAILEKPSDEHAPEGATRLSLVAVEEPIHARLSFDNFGSRFLGPYEVTAQAAVPIIANQKTTIAVLAATQLKELKYGSINHQIPLDEFWLMDLDFSHTITRPGYTLSPQEIDSVSTSYGLGFTYQWIRQRQENLSLRVGMDARRTHSDLLDKSFPLTRDDIRAARASLSYQVAEGSGTYNSGVLTFSQGLPILGSSDANEANLSRAQAKPNFNKLELQYTRLQPLFGNMVGVGSLSGQLASGPLYSSEEFGYGGQSFGRAYDASEITGDQGIAASLEMRYNGLPALSDVQFSPYGFYDIGCVYNDDAGQQKKASGSSAGLGLHAATELGITANMGVAFPLTREIATPVYGNGKSPRYMLQLSYDY